MLDVVDRARTIIDAYEDEDGLLDDEPELSEFRELLETLP
jgi:hypothetical protein